MSAEAIAFVQSVISALIGAGVVYFFGIRQMNAERRSRFSERQLVEFYAPISGLRRQVQAKSEFRQVVSEAADTAWKKICERQSESLPDREQEMFAPYERLIDYDNGQLRDELVPLYREMLRLFTDRYHLADGDTREHYEDLLEFVEIWNRWLSEALPHEVLRELGHDEKKLFPFYEHIDKRMADLQARVGKKRSTD